MKNIVVKYSTETNFPSFLAALRRQDDAAWEWLLNHFRERVVPYIRKKDGRLPKDAIVSTEYFIEEVFSNSLIKFYELFEKGNFSNLGQLRGLMFRIAEIKLKEAYRQLKRDRVLYFSENESSKNQIADTVELTEREQKEQKVILKLESALKHLPESDREVLLRFAKGERLKNIAADLDINEVSCRKKKQRALGKLRKLLSPLLGK